MSMSLFKNQLYFIKSEFKSEYLCRMCSVAANLVRSIINPFQSAMLLCCVVLANHGTVPYSPNSFISTALLETVLQANMEPFRNTMVKMRNHKVETRNGLGARLVPVQNVFERCAVRSYVHFKNLLMNSF